MTNDEGYPVFQNQEETMIHALRDYKEVVDIG